MGSNLDRVATAAMAAGALLAWCLAQPGLRQRLCQRVLPQSGRPVQQPGMTALAQQYRSLLRQPGRQQCQASFLYDRQGPAPVRAATMMASQPRRTITLVICCQTLWRCCAASMRTKRCGAWAARSA